MSGYGPSGNCYCPKHNGTYVNGKLWACEKCGYTTGCSCSRRSPMTGKRIPYGWAWLCMSQRMKLQFAHRHPAPRHAR